MFWPIFTSLPVNLITDTEFWIYSAALVSCIINKMKPKHLISSKSDDKKNSRKEILKQIFEEFVFYTKFQRVFQAL